MDNTNCKVTHDPALILAIQKIGDDFVGATPVKVEMHTGRTYTGNASECTINIGASSNGKNWARGCVLVTTGGEKFKLDILDIKSWSFVA